MALPHFRRAARLGVAGHARSFSTPTWTARVFRVYFGYA